MPLITGPSASNLVAEKKENNALTATGDFFNSALAEAGGAVNSAGRFVNRQLTNANNATGGIFGDQETGRVQLFKPFPSGTTSVTEDTKLRGPYAGGPITGPGAGQERNAFVLTSDLWQSDSIAKKLVLHAGPSEVQWSIPLRSSTEDTKGGRAHYMQSRPRGGNKRTYFNLPTAAFTFQTGNILPMAITGTETTLNNGVKTDEKKLAGFQVPFGLQDFYYFLELINQPPIVPSGTSEGKHNYIWVYYSSLQFPKIVLKGYFEPDGVSWTDSAEAPNSFTWSASMAVYESTPELEEPLEQINGYLDSIKLF